MSFEWKAELKPLALMLAVFLLFYYAPLQLIHAENFAMEALYLAQDYARLHVVTCLVPAFFIAGAISVFISQAAVIKYFGPKANKPLAYGVASVSGAILAVCSCTVLPLFAGIYTMGAGIGPATTFLYSGPAINVLAVILTARVLGMELGIARAVGAVVFSLAIGLLMHFFFRRSELKRSSAQPVMPDEEETRPLWQNAVYFALLVVILVFANWGSSGGSGAWELLYTYKWWLTGAAGLLLGVVLASWLKLEWWKVGAVAGVVAVFAAVFPRHPLVAFGAAIIGVSLITSLSRGEPAAWFSASWGFAKQILPLLLIGVLVAGALLGRPGHEGLIPSHWIASAVGGNSLPANLFASVAGALMYFATLTEVPILQGLIGSGMGKGPALALLLAGPAVSLPNLLVIRSIMGTRKTLAFLALVVIMATIAGYLYGVVF